jgi:predicted Rdx family selenoprotein
VAELMQRELGEEVALEVGDRGEFTVWVDGRVVARKTLDGFPADEDCLAAARGALAG